MAEGGMKFVKLVLFIFNLLFFLAGLGLIIAGAVIYTQLNTYVDFFGARFSAIALVLVVIGGLVFVVGFLGCCGAYKEQYCMIMTFAGILAVIFIIEIGVGIATYVMRDSIRQEVHREMSAAAEQYNVTGADSVTKTWDVVQHDFECCGVTNYTTWSALRPDVPDSCCVTESEGCGRGGYENYNARYHQDGCVEKMEENMSENILIIAGLLLGLALVQLIGIILACCLGRSINHDYTVV